MSSKGRIDSIADIPKIEAEIKTILAGLGIILEKLEDIADKSAGMKFNFTGAKNINDLNSSFANLNNALTEANATVDQHTKAQKKLIDAAAALDKQRQAALLLIAKQEAKERELQAAIQMQVKSIKDAELQNRALRIERDKLNQTTDEGRKKTNELNKIIDKNTQLIRSSNDVAGKQRMNIGNYANAFGDALSNMGINASGFTSTLGGMTSGLGPAGIAIGLVTGASKLLGSALSATDTLADKFAETISSAKAATSVFFTALATGDFSNFIGNIRTAIDEGREYARVMDQIEDSRRSMQLLEAEDRGRVLDLLTDLKNVNLPLEQRKKSAKEVIDIENANAAKKAKLSKDALDAELRLAAVTKGGNKDKIYDIIKNIDAYKSQFEILDKVKGLQDQINNTTDPKTRFALQLQLDKVNALTASYYDDLKAFANLNEERQKIADLGVRYWEDENSAKEKLQRTEARYNTLIKEGIEQREKGNASAAKIAEDEAKRVKAAAEELYKQNIESLQREAAISELKLSLVRKGSDDELLLKYDLLKKQEALEIAQAEKSGQDVADIRLKYAKKWIDETLAASIKGIEDESRSSLMALDKSQADELKQLRDQLENKEINLEEFEKRRSALETKYDIQRAENAINLARVELEAIEAAGGDTLAAREKLAKAEIDLDDLKTNAVLANIKTTTDEQVKADGKVLESRKKITEALIDLGQELFNTLQAFSNARFEDEFNKIDLQNSKDQEAKDSEIRRAGKNQGLVDQINARYDAKQKQRDAQRRKLELEQAKAARQFALMQIGINTAQAIMKIWAEVPKGDYGIATIALTAIAAGIGLAEAGAVAATPLPKYRTGRKGGPAELAIVGEVGSELITYDDGTMALTPPKPTVTFLPAGASVTPHQDLMNNPGLFMDRKVTSMPDKGFDTRSLENKIDSGFNRLSETVKNKQEHHWNITEKGFSHMVRNGQAWSSYINKKHRS